MLPAFFAIALLVQVTPMPGPVTVTAEKPKLVCREGEAQLGTHMRTGRTCKTAQQWEEIDSDSDRRHPPPSLTIHKDQLEGAPNVQPQ